MTTIGLLITAIIAAMCSGVAYDIIGYCIEQHKKKDYEKLDKHEDYIISGYHGNVNGYNYSGMSNMDKQIVYKVDGNFNGDIKGDNVTVILMGDGDFNGNINSKDGEVVVIKGDINGDVKANKVLCPTDSKTGGNSSDCFKCAWLDENGTCKSWDVNEGKCKYVDKTQIETLWSCYIPQGTSPQIRTDYYTSIGNHVSIYDSFPVAHIRCPHCKKYFATQLNVKTSVVDSDVVETSVEEIKPDY